MNSFTFDPIALSVRDVAKSVRFYQHVFDLTEIENTAAKSATRWLSLGEGKELHLIPRPEADRLPACLPVGWRFKCYLHAYRSSPAYSSAAGRSSAVTW